jgi:hypothetical protein
MEIPDLKELLEKNPQVDTAQVREVLGAVEELKKRGVARASYNLVSPYRRSTATESHPQTEDSRLVKLKATR